MTAKRAHLTPAAQKKLCMAIGLGAPMDLAVLYAGLRRETVWRWLTKGRRQTRGIYHDLVEAVDEAEGKAVVGCLAVIRKASQEQWQAAAWLLERRYRAFFGRSWVEETPAETREGIVNINIDARTLQTELVADMTLIERAAKLPGLKAEPKNGNGHHAEPDTEGPTEGHAGEPEPKP